MLEAMDKSSKIAWRACAVFDPLVAATGGACSVSEQPSGFGARAPIERLRRILAELRSVYTLTVAADPALPRTIEVHVKRPEMTVRVRKGY
jgi:hypothetical protein